MLKVNAFFAILFQFIQFFFFRSLMLDAASELVLDM